MKDKQSNTSINKSLQAIIGLVFLSAFLLRLALVFNPGFEADISFWKSWGLATRDLGIVEGIKKTNNNYPTPFSYTLGLMVYVYSLFKDPHNFNQFWSNRNFLFLLIAKMPAILADLGIAAIILWLGKSAKRLGFPNLPFSFYFLLSTFYLFNPISLLDGAWWGQVDSLGVFIFLLSFVLVLKNQPFLAGFIYLAAVMTKLQNMVYGPLFFLFLLQFAGFRGLVKAMAGSALAFFALNFEFLLGREMGRVVASLTENYDYFPWASLNAFNLWWIVVDGKGMEVTDKFLTLGLLNAKKLGLLIFSSFYLFAIIRQLANSNSRHILKTFIEGLIVVNATFFLFQTQSHDRYAFPLSVFLLLWLLFALENILFKLKFKKAVKILFWGYLAYSLVYFYNLHTALVLNYPQNGLLFLSGLIQKPLTIIASYFQLGLFFLFLYYLLSQTPKISLILPAAAFLTMVSLSNLPLLTKKSVSLTKFTPYISQQDFGQRTTDMPIISSRGFDKWTRLSTQYAFYKKGIGTHANSYIVYDINKQFKRFSFDYGIDTTAGEKGSAVFAVWGDGRKLFESNKIGRFALPGHGEADISGVKKLELTVSDAGDGITDDHADWLNPKLWP